MRRGFASLALWAAALAAAPAAAAQVVEGGVHGLVLARDPAFVGGGVQAGIRTTPRTRFMATLSGGALDDEVAGRGELLGHFLLNPFDATGVGLYGGGGLGAEVSHGEGRAYVVLLLGAEGRPAAGSGWFVEAGLGGGFRGAVGWRWRRLPAGWPRGR